MNNLRHWCRCVITGNGGSSYSYLGRPWGPFGRVVFAYTYMDQCIKHVGWNNWGKPENERNACFYEYRYLVFILVLFSVLLLINTYKYAKSSITFLYRKFEYNLEVATLNCDDTMGHDGLVVYVLLETLIQLWEKIKILSSFYSFIYLLPGLEILSLELQMLWPGLLSIKASYLG